MALVNTACSSGLVGLPLPKTTLATTTSTSTPGRSPRVTRLPVLKVVGDRLELSSGRRFVMRGVIVYAMPFYETDRKADPALASVTANAYTHRKAMFARVKALGFNTVKIPISAAIYASDPYIPGGKNGYLARLRTIVDTATSEGLYVVLCWWDALGEGSSVLRDYPDQYPMMKAVARMFSDNPSVIYEPLGEPNRINWEQWLVMSEKMLRYCRTTMGYRAVIIADTADWSWVFDPTYVGALIRYDGALLGKPDLLIANHRYPNRNSCFCGGTLKTWNSLVGQYIGHFPFVGTEYGIFNGIGSVELSWGKDFLTYLKHKAIPLGFNGALMFVWNWVDPNTMTNLSTGKLTAWGTAIVASLGTSPSGVSAG